MSLRSYTANYSFGLINFDSPTWHTDDDARWNTLDGVIASIENTIPFAIAFGSPNAYEVLYPDAIAGYASGQIYSFIANFAATGTATLNVNSLGAKTLKLNGSNIVTGDIPKDSYVRVIYDGTNFNLIDPKKPTATTNFIFIGSSGGTPDPLADDWYVESDQATSGISLLGVNTATQRFLFARANDADAGGFIYDHTFDTLVVRVAGATAATFGSDGKLTNTNGFVGPLTGAVTGTVSGNAGTATKWETARTLSFTGDATGSGLLDGSANLAVALTIPAASIENTQLANMATATFKGRATAGTGDPEDLTPAQATSLLNVFTTALKGLVPASSSTASSHNYVLVGDASFKKGIGRFAGGRLTRSGNAVSGAVNISSVSFGGGTPEEITVTMSTAAADTNYQVAVTPIATTPIADTTASNIAVEIVSTTVFIIHSNSAYTDYHVSVFEG